MSRESLPTDFVDARPLDEVGRKLLEAATVVRERGWFQGDYSSEFGAVCTVGALLVAHGFPANKDGIDTALYGSDSEAAHRAAMRRLQKATGAEIVHLWNDAPDRTAAEVIAALEQAAFSP